MRAIGSLQPAVSGLQPEEVAADAGEAVFEVAAVHKLIHDLRDDRAQEAVAGLKALFVDSEKRGEMPGQALPEGRGPGLALAVGLHLPVYMQPKSEILHTFCILASALRFPLRATAGIVYQCLVFLRRRP